MIQKIKCFLFHRRHHFMTQVGNRLCQICDADLIEYLIARYK